MDVSANIKRNRPRKECAGEGGGGMRLLGVVGKPTVCLVEPGGFRTEFAKNIEWPLGTSTQQSAYKDQMIGYQNFLKRISGKKPGRDPAQVAEVVFQLANKNAMPVRIRVGSDTQAIYYLRRSLPEQIADRLLRKIGNNILQTK